jgi:hypothetical protein
MIMKPVKLFEQFINDRLNEQFLRERRGYVNFEEIQGGKKIVLFRGQSDNFFKQKKQGYSEAYGMIFMSALIDSALFYTKPGRSKVREILMFEIPNNIMRISGKYIDRATEERKKAKEEGFVGIVSDIGELDADWGEVGVFDFYKPVKKWQTTTGAFSMTDLKEMSKFGPSEWNQNREIALMDSQK